MKYETRYNIDDKVDEDDLYKIDKICLDEKTYDKRAFESELINIYDTKKRKGLNCINEKKVNKISECNLLYDIIETSVNSLKYK